MLSTRLNIANPQKPVKALQVERLIVVSSAQFYSARTRHVTRNMQFVIRTYQMLDLFI